MNSNPDIPMGGSQGSSPSRSNLAIRAKDIMTTNVITVDPETTVHGIARLLSDKHVSAAIVADRGSIVGIVSEGDLMNRQELGTEFVRASLRGNVVDNEEARAAEAKSRGMYARDVMTRNVIAVQEDAALAEVVKVLQAHHIRRVPVTRGTKLVGIVSRADVMRALTARPEGSRGPTSRDDDMIRYQVVETLLSIPGTSPWATTVGVARGVVELTGSVENEVTRDPSRIAIELIPGVVEVRDYRSVMQPY
ncbi:MAG: CBS domain-containing protein [Reyranella sp.]|nr:CBS domain-containing protein [Reyranella sp.]